MKTSNQVTVIFPTGKADITLPPVLAHAANALLQHVGKYLSTMDLHELGIVSVPYVIDSLKQHGAVIEKVRKPANATFGHQSRLNHYKLVTWL